MKKTVKFIAIIVALALIATILYFTNGLVGNPISKFLVEVNSKKYIEENYGDLDLTSEIGFNFKSTNYYVNVKSETVEDLHFSLYYSLTGRLQRDLYENNITDGWNVLTRIGEEYRHKADVIFDELDLDDFFDGKYFHTHANLISAEDAEYIPGLGNIDIVTIDGRSLELDKEYDVSELGKTSGMLDVSLNFADGVDSFERGAQALKNIKKAFDDADMGFAYFSFGVYNAEGNYAFRVEYFPYDEIDSEDLAKRLEEADVSELNEY